MADDGEAVQAAARRARQEAYRPGDGCAARVVNVLPGLVGVAGRVEVVW